MVTSGQKVQILVCDKGAVIETSSVLYNKTYGKTVRKLVAKPKYQKYKIYENFDTNKLFAVGEMLDSENSRFLRVTKVRPAKFKKPKRPNFRSFDKNKLEDSEKTKKVLSSISSKKVARAQKVLKAVSSDDEVAYRCFYNSFKMYRVRDEVFSMAQSLIELCGGTEATEKIVYGSVVEEFNKMKFDQVLTACLQCVNDVEFNLDRNEASNWIRDSKELFAARVLFQNALSYQIRFTKRVLSGNIFLLEERSLSWDEAGAMEVYPALRTLRYLSNKEESNEYEKLLTVYKEKKNVRS